MTYRSAFWYIVGPAVVVGLAVSLFFTVKINNDNGSQKTRLARQNVTINNLSKSVARLSEQRFVKCRAERNKFEKVLDANANDAYDVLIATLLASSGEVTPAVEAAFTDRLKASENYRAAVTAPDNCKSF